MIWEAVEKIFAIAGTITLIAFLIAAVLELVTSWQGDPNE